MRRSRSLVFAVFAGPSGGHLFPALSFSECLKSKHPEARIFFITSHKGKALTEGFPSGIFEEIIFIENFPSSPGISLRTFAFLLKLARAFTESFRCLSRIKPDMSIGFGSYVSFPGLILSSWKKIPTLIHEQNQVPGKANVWLAGHVDAVAISFKNTFQRQNRGRLFFTGLPIRKTLVDVAQNRNTTGFFETLDGGRKLRILVVGGSQGAKFLNQIVLKAFSHLSPEEKEEFAVTHITGKTDFDAVSAAYLAGNVEARVFPFFEKMETLYAESDLAICRAGANTLFELALFQVPAIVVPYPHAGGHQLENATEFVNRQAVFCEPESALTDERLISLIRKLKKDETLRVRMSSAMKDAAVPDAPERLVELAIANLKGQQP